MGELNNQRPARYRLLFKWTMGILVGTLLIALTSPWFVRSYLPLVVDPIRKTWVLKPGSEYRWRSEGYANSKIGPLGMPGRTQSIPNIPQLGSTESSGEPAQLVPRLRIALWGDSQVEGVCVPDTDKLFAVTERLSGGAVEVFPLARSGEDAADWLTQISTVERYLKIDLHVLMVVDLEDLFTAPLAPLSPPSNAYVNAANAAIAARFPAFIIQAARNLLTEGDGATPRKLRFGLGPVGDPVGGVAVTDSAEVRGDPVFWSDLMRSIRQSTAKPIWILDAPVLPLVVGGKIQSDRSHESEYKQMRAAAMENHVLVVSAKDALIREANQGRWPHGFHHGRIGSGHLNPIGNQVIAEVLLRAIDDQLEAAKESSSQSFDETSSDLNQLQWIESVKRFEQDNVALRELR